MADWPWQRKINPYYEEAKEASTVWLKAMKPFSEESQHAFNKCNNGLLAALAWPYAPPEILRVGCDMLNLLFVIDEYTDVQPANEVKRTTGIVLDALSNPEKARPVCEIALGELSRQFWTLTTQTSSLTSQTQLFCAFKDYLTSVVAEAVDRDNQNVRTVEQYFETRRENIGARPGYMMSILGLSLPDEVLYHPEVVGLGYNAADLLIIDNDLASYNREQATSNDNNNILTVVMHHYGLTLDQAVEWAAEHHSEKKACFLDGLDRLPSFGEEVNYLLMQYVNGIAMWPRANGCWSFEGSRYFGDKGMEIQKTRRVPLLPRIARDDQSVRNNNVSVILVKL